MRAIWQGQVIAESDDIEVVEGNYYFPRTSLHEEFFAPSDTTSVCSWKGEAGYLHIEVDGAVNTDAAWFYANPKPQAQQIADRVAFWRGVEITP